MKSGALMDGYCWVEGELLPANQATLSVFDIGFQRGYGVFDVVRTYNGKLFHFEDHLSRLNKSAEKLFLKLPFKARKIQMLAYELIKKSHIESPLIKMILTGGIPNDTDPNFIMTIEPLPVYRKDIYSRGAKLITNKFQREHPEIKSTNYLNSLLLEPLRKRLKAVDILYYTEHGITECARSNIFMVRNRILYTPGRSILKGITRNIVLGLSRKELEVKERTFTLSDLYDADEIFITSTSKGLLPIVRLDNRKIGSGSVGPVTIKLMTLYNKYLESYAP